MFIPREQFLLDFQNNPGNGQFCSPPLIHAICAIGACMSTNPSIKEYAPEFSVAAHRLLFPQGLGTPHLTSVQALLCCAFYELSKGDFSRAWIFSGMASVDEDLIGDVNRLRYGLQNGSGSWIPARSQALAGEQFSVFRSSES